MGSIVPAIIPTSREDLEYKLALLHGICEEVQIDIVDGRYAMPASWPYIGDPSEPSRMLSEGALFPYAGEFRFEVDLMTTDVTETVAQWAELGATRLTVHATSTRQLSLLFTHIREQLGHDTDFAPGLLSLGLAIGADTDIALIEPYLDRVEYVQFMGIKTIGHQGEPFDMGVLPRISAFKKKYPRIEITVDGGVSLQTAPKLLQIGVSRLVVGSAIWKALDPVQAYRELAALTITHGIYG